MPCSENAKGGLRLPPYCPAKKVDGRDVTICDFTRFEAFRNDLNIKVSVGFSLS